MKINVLGGGPAGLYFGILAKKAFPAADIEIFERNGADDTFGWGVVFSDETLGNLETADAESYKAITESFAYWDSVDVLHKGKMIRSSGHGFCGVSRMKLLKLLQARCAELGVKMNFGVDVEDFAPLLDCDLFVAADGINSRVREAYREHFEPVMEPGACHFTWLGTHQSFEAFTFLFRENEHGIWQVHAYQFEPGTSTFIVETDPETFKNAGLDPTDEAATIAYCEKLFAEDLGGHGLMANRSHWIHFRKLTSARWYKDNIALIGDAAHTAHFTVGSGTKMAMEDVIDLVEGMKAHEQLPDALAAYEEVGKDRIGRTQKAALQSREWFENVRRHIALPPERLVFSLLSRSRRITHDNMQLRDPEYVEALDRWYDAEQGVSDPEGRVVPPMFTPFSVRGMELSNRVVVSPMCQYSAEDGTPSDWHMVHYGSRAQGGAALVFTEMTDVSAEGRITPGCTGLYSDEHVGAWTRIVDYVHEHTSAKLAVQLGHAGRKGATKLLWEGMDEPLPTGGWPLLAPSAIAWAEGSVVPQEMTRQDMVRVRDEHVASAKLAAKAGFDMLELHCAHGYLLSSFLTPLSNQRGDDYGGSLENRARYPLEVFDAVREVWADKPLSVRISATDWVAGGFDEHQAADFAAMLKEHGVDIVDVSTGQTSTQAEPVYGRAYQAPFSERIRNMVGIPTMTVGSIWDADRINTILLAGRADLVALARAHLADPYFTRHAALAQGYWDPSWPKQYESCQPIAERMFGLER